jgi:hypothetical protein
MQNCGNGYGLCRYSIFDLKLIFVSKMATQSCRSFA